MNTTTHISDNISQTQSVSERLYVLDFIRLVAMLFMMQGHTIWALARPEDLDISTFPFNVWHFLRGLTAPIFLMVSGAVHIFANKRGDDGSIAASTIIRRLRWGLTVIGIGYLLVFPAGNIFHLPWVSQKLWDGFFAVNILQLAGASLILLTLLFAVTRSNKSVTSLSLGIGIAIALATPWVNSYDWYAVLPEWAAAYFTYQRRTIFPLFPFAAYMFIGVAIGNFLKNTPPAERLSRFTGVMWKIGLLVAGTGWLLSQADLPIFPDHSYYASNPFFVMIRTGLGMVWMSFFAVVYKYTRSLEKHYSLLGKRSLHVYVIHLFILYGTAFFDSFDDYYARSLSIGESYMVAFIVIGGSLGCIYLYEYIRSTSFHAEKLLRYSSVGIALYILLL